jgi:ribulose-phosphate 3-epimerase
MEIIPAIIPNTYEEIEKKVEMVHTNAKTIQLDFMDGTYVDRKTWPFKETTGVQFSQIIAEYIGMPLWESIDYELDLMMIDPVLDDLYKIGPIRIILHIGALTNPKEYFSKIDQYFKEQIKFGVAVRPSDNLDIVYELIDSHDISFVQCMGIDKVGYQGNPFDERVINQIKTLRSKYPDLPISVDGSVNNETAKSLIDAGATRLVIGSAIFSSNDPIGEIDYFKSL